jgi:hypothetical protein
VIDDLFAQPRTCEKQLELVVFIAGQRFDFGEIRAMRDAAAVIVEISVRAQRRAALESIPPGFREQVVILVERAFYERGQRAVD